MNHRKYGYKLGRNRRERDALFRSQVRSVLEKGAIETTYAKTKAIRGLVENVVHSIMTVDGVGASRLISSYIQDKHLISRILSAVKTAFNGQTANFTRIQKTRIRQGDDAVMARISFVRPYSLSAPVTKEESKKTEEKTKKTEVTKVSAKGRSSSGQKKAVAKK